ncbi:hypothetical protein EYF80_028831 [Liparis tanakae]|uniref:Uncharacterized protein n=1 Tax=Liparis tanakae TaxID=230148 RepID=A0A4Z2H5M9_9TELE|nr:hypothetical protein EYF80_028831 [Liparis tanakae]
MCLLPLVTIQAESFQPHIVVASSATLEQNGVTLISAVGTIPTLGAGSYVSSSMYLSSVRAFLCSSSRNWARSGVKVSSVWMTVSGAMSSSLSAFHRALSSERM